MEILVRILDFYDQDQILDVINSDSWLQYACGIFCDRSLCWFNFHLEKILEIESGYALCNHKQIHPKMVMIPHPNYFCLKL